MDKRNLLILAFAILFLLFVQSIATFIEAIYILELLSTSLDEKIVAVLMLFSPVLLIPFSRRVPGWFIWIAYIFLLLGRSTAPYLNTFGRLIAAGVATAAALILIPLMLVTYAKPHQGNRWLIPAQGLALAVGLSIMLRTVNFTIDISLTSSYAWIGWLLAVLLGILLTQFRWEDEPSKNEVGTGITSASVGIVAVLTLFFFMLSSPGVIARWTEGNYQLIVISVSLLSLLWLFLTLYNPGWVGMINPILLTLWNILFSISIVGTILAHTIQFPLEPGSPTVVVHSPVWYQQIPMVFMIVLFPVIFIDFGVFSGLIARAHPTPRQMAPGFLLGLGFFVILIFMNIFSNTWGYVEPISPFFRNKFWLPFLLVTGLVTILVAILRRKLRTSAESSDRKSHLLMPAIILASIFVITLVFASITERSIGVPPDKDSLLVMTYNIQQANDIYGEKSYEEQLALIREVGPDIIGFQENDSTRISLANNDYIRYYANKLGYHTYYGPKTVTGTYGTAILSKYPLENIRTVFTYSDQDEIGTAEAEIRVGDKRFTIFNVHPAGSDLAMMAFTESLLSRAANAENVLAIGDYNLRGWETAYLLIDAEYKNAWMDVYPTGIDENGLDMSGENRIDHIFLSPHLIVEDTVYVLPPESWTDHPVHWAVISW
jgi:endonuclease/exonuclease/phosphatase family metal-dependent hydrolase